MANGSLTIGDTLLNYGGGTSQWNSSTAGLLMECLDNTEIAFHDAGNRIASGIRYVGNTTNSLILGRDMGWGAISTIVLNGNVGIGTTNPNGVLELSSTSQSTSRIILSGQEFFQSGNTSSSGISLLLGVNRSGNRQLWIADSANLTQNTTNGTIRIIPTGTPTIDALATDGATRLNMNIGGSLTILSSGNVGIASSSPTEKLDVNGNIKASGNITNGSGSYIYAGGLRLGGWDPNTIYQTGNIGISARKGRHRKCTWCVV